MNEEIVVETVEKKEKELSTSDRFAKGVFGYMVGFVASHYAEKAYEHFIIDGRLKALIRRK